MYTLIKIKSISDVITNSSTEVFALERKYLGYFEGHKEDDRKDGDIQFEPITWEWLKEHPFFGLVGEICNIPNWRKTYSEYYDNVNERGNIWNDFLEENKVYIEDSDLFKMVFLMIEDGCLQFNEIIEKAKWESRWFDKWD